MKQRSDAFGAAMGFLTFLGGIGLLAYTFKLAFDLFSVSPEKALNIQGPNGIDLAKSGQSFGWIVVKVVLLLVMAAVGSMIANRGIKLYVSSRVLPAIPKESEAPITSGASARLDPAEPT
jgi:hypothetical protein